jgi:hypothetical protein
VTGCLVSKRGERTAAEYDTLRGNLLLRVSGKLNPSVADQYKAAFTA